MHRAWANQVDYSVRVVFTFKLRIGICDGFWDLTDYNSVGHAQIEFTQLQSAGALQTIFFEISKRGLAELIAGCMNADGEWLTTGDK